MRILLSGSSGLVGSALLPALKAGGHQIIPLTRSQADSSGLFWEPSGGVLDASKLQGFDAVIHLAGESIATGRWTRAKKQRIRNSRVLGTQCLAKTLTGLASPPKTWICASAIGFYGDRGEETLTESGAPGAGFLAEVCREWEAATAPAVQKGIRVVNLRFGIILSSRGGALAQMLLPFKLGVGGKIGSGKQYMSWIALDDVVEVIGYALKGSSLQGPVNVVAPRPVTNLEFTKTLGRVLKRPTLFPLPAFAARLVFGEMAQALLLSSQRVLPAKLIQSGYKFLYPELEGALRHVLGKAA